MVDPVATSPIAVAGGGDDRVGIVLAGGRSSRMRQPKQALVKDGRTLLQGCVDAALAAGCRRVVVVAPDEAVGSVVTADDRVMVTLENPPLGGPVAGIAAGMAFADGADEVVLLACDLPFAGGIVPSLVAAPLEADAVVPVDGEGWPQWLAARYRGHVLRATLSALPSVRDVSVNRTMAGLSRHELRLPDELLADVDTPEDAARAGISLADDGPGVPA